MPAALTHEQAEAKGLTADHPAELLESFKNTRAIHKYRFLECGHEWEIRTSNLHNGSGCGECHFDQGPTYLYVMQRGDVLKIGMTAVAPERYDHCRIYRHSKDGFVLIDKKRHETRAEAHAEEQAEIQRWRDDGIPPALEPGELKFGGEGETVSRDLVNVHEILKRLN